MADLSHDATYFLELQTKTGWGRVLERFADWCAPQAGTRALDLGTGPGLFPALLAERGAQAVGLDHDRVNFALPQHDALLVGDAMLAPFPGASFDLITASNLLYLLPDPESVLLEIARLLTPGGALCMLNPSETMSLQSATQLADEAGLDGLARDTLLNYGSRAEEHGTWSIDDLESFFATAGLTFSDTKTTMGPGLVRYARARK